MEFEILSDDSGVTIIKGTGEEKCIIIPAEIDGKPVRKIGNYAFSDNLHVKEVIIEAEIIEIGDFSFQFCEQLERIDLPSSLLRIGVSAFEGCISLKSINIPSLKIINKLLL